MALTWASPDQSVLSLALVSHRKWRFVEDTAKRARRRASHRARRFLRHDDGIVDRLADYVRATGRGHP
jgi:hypothetical protein